MSKIRNRPIAFTERDAERLWSHVVRTSTCWIWMGAVSDDGYGRMRARLTNGEQVTVTPHRAAAQLALGLPAVGMTHLHECEVRLCCRVDPDHVRLGTQAENQQQAVARGRRTAAGDATGGSVPSRWRKRSKRRCAIRTAPPDELAARLAAVLPKQVSSRPANPAAEPGYLAGLTLFDV